MLPFVIKKQAVAAAVAYESSKSVRGYLKNRLREPTKDQQRPSMYVEHHVFANTTAKMSVFMAKFHLVVLCVLINRYRAACFYFYFGSRNLGCTVPIMILLTLPTFVNWNLIIFDSDHFVYT